MQRRIAKTVALGVIALVALCWSMYRFWDVPTQDIAAVVLAGFILTFALGVCALVIVTLFYLLGRLRKRKPSYLIDEKTTNNDG